MATAEERDFQLQIAEAETSISNVNTCIVLVVAIAFTLFGVLWAISASANSVLNSSTIISGNLTGGGNSYSGQVVVPMNSVTAFFSKSTFFEYVLGSIGTVGLGFLLLHHFYLAPRKFRKIRQKFIHTSEPNPNSTSNKT